VGQTEACQPTSLALTTGENMVLKITTPEGSKVYGPPYTKQEEREFYSRNSPQQI
jgi:hypothetical protein